jgi:hypothetical protein
MADPFWCAGPSSRPSLLPPRIALRTDPIATAAQRAWAWCSLLCGTIDEPNWCAHPSADMVGKDERNLTGSNGQACECIVQPVRKGMLPVA